MSTIWVEVYKSYAKRDFNVGEFYPIEVPPDILNDRYEFINWINRLAYQGLVFHSHILGTYLFRAEIPSEV